MPHAALFVVQDEDFALIRGEDYCFNAARGFVCGARCEIRDVRYGCVVFQCRTRLCLWCKINNDPSTYKEFRFQCRTRLCLWCKFFTSVYTRLLNAVSMPHAALFVVQGVSMWPKHANRRCFNAARGFVCGASLSLLRILCSVEVSMPHAALFVVQAFVATPSVGVNLVSMPHAALFVVQGTIHSTFHWTSEVSMPHAALFVVQGTEKGEG